MTPHTAASDTFDFPRDPGIGSAISSGFIKLTSVPRPRALLLGAIGAAALMAVVFYLSLPVTQGRSLAELRPGELLGAGMLGVDATALAVGAIAAAVCVAAAPAVAGAVGIDPSLILTGAGIQLALGSIAMPVLYAVIAASAAFVCQSAAQGVAIPLAVMAVGGLAGWFGDSISALLTPLMPVAAIHSLSGVATGHESIGIADATVSILAWLGVSIGAAAWRFLPRDA